MCELGAVCQCLDDSSGFVQREDRRKIRMEKQKNNRSCENCLFEYYCDWKPAEGKLYCPEWEQEDLEMQQEKEKLKYTE